MPLPSLRPTIPPTPNNPTEFNSKKPLKLPSNILQYKVPDIFLPITLDRAENPSYIDFAKS
jgi:hypothetical protein